MRVRGKVEKELLVGESAPAPQAAKARQRSGAALVADGDAIALLRDGSSREDAGRVDAGYADIVDVARRPGNAGGAVQRFAPDVRPDPDPSAEIMAQERKKIHDAAARPPPRPVIPEHWRPEDFAPPPPPPPPRVVPGSVQQQEDLIDVDFSGLWTRQDVQDQMKKLATETEQREAALRHGGKVTHTADAMMEYWRVRFVESVEYILTERPRGADPTSTRLHPKPRIPVRAKLRKQLALDEDQIIAKVPADQQVAAVEAVRARIRQQWEAEIERAIAGYIAVASNESILLTRPNAPKPAEVLGLPKGLEGERDAKSAPKELTANSDPVAESVVTFMTAVQAESKVKAQAYNYPRHELWNAHFDDSSIGKYSFDIMLPFEVNAAGFYDTAKTIDFLKAVERASANTKIEWVAFYNDATVVLAVNNAIGKGRVAFSGGGNHGQFHHGPDPYILHLHMNIMPLALRDRYLVGKTLGDIKKKLDAYWAAMGALF